MTPPAFLQLIYDLSSMDTHRRYGPGWLCKDDDDDNVIEFLVVVFTLLFIFLFLSILVFNHHL